MIASEEDELLSAMAGAPTEFEAALDSEDSTLRRRALTDAKIQAMGRGLPVVSRPVTNRPESVSAFENDPSLDSRNSGRSGESTPIDGTRGSRGGGFDWARALTAFGGGDVGAMDANRRYSDQAGSRELDMKAKREEMADKQLTRQNARALLDPNSPQSKQAQSRFAIMANGLADSEGVPEKLASQLRKASIDVSGMSAKDIQGLTDSYQGLIGNALKFRESARKVEHDKDTLKQKSEHDKLTAQLRREGISASNANAMAMRMLTGARFAETKNENANRQQDRLDKKDEKEAELYGKDVAPLNETNELLDAAVEAKKHVNTGIFSNFFQKAAQKLGVESKAFDELEKSIGAVDNQITNLVSGKTVTASEGGRLRRELAELDMDDQEFDIKLQGIRDRVAMKLREANKKHPQTSGSKQTPQAKSPPNGQRVKQNGKWFTWNGEKYVKE